MKEQILVMKEKKSLFYFFFFFYFWGLLKIVYFIQFAWETRKHILVHAYLYGEGLYVLIKEEY